MVNPLRSLARLFLTPCDEWPERTEKYISGTNIEYSREIKSSYTGRTIAYEQNGGAWITVQQGRISRGGAVITEETDEEFEAVKAVYGWKM